MKVWLLTKHKNLMSLHSILLVLHFWVRCYTYLTTFKVPKLIINVCTVQSILLESLLRNSVSFRLYIWCRQHFKSHSLSLKSAINALTHEKTMREKQTCDQMLTCKLTRLGSCLWMTTHSRYCCCCYPCTLFWVGCWYVSEWLAVFNEYVVAYITSSRI